jgi:hypothetical protein
LKQQNPALKLADAQYILAGEYGFASWPKLKVFVESLQHAENVNPFVGKWIANLSKSKRHPANQFQSATIEFSVDGDTVTIVDTLLDESGREQTTRNTILVDENEHSSVNGYILIASWIHSHAFETIAKKDGQQVGWGVYEVSADGKILTISSEEQTILLDRD